MESLIIFMLIGLFAISRLVSRHPQASGTIAKGIFGMFFRK
jgi:hypothetical protein